MENNEEDGSGNSNVMEKRAKRPSDTKVAAAIIIATVIIVASILIAFSPNGFLGIGGSHSKSPMQESDYIVWSINGTENGTNVSGVSIWTFSNVTGHANVAGMENWPKYDISVCTILDGNSSVFDTAGAYQNSNVWGLGINPAGIVTGIVYDYSGYYNGITPTFSTNETISTVLGNKEAAVYSEQYQSGASYIWIDSGNGCPIKMNWTGSVGVDQFNKPFVVTMTFDILGTNIGS